MVRKIVLFLLLFAALELGWQSVRDSSVARSLIEQAIVKPAAFAINHLSSLINQPSSPHAYAAGSQLRSEGGSLNIVNGCDGVELLCLLISGFAVAPVPWRSRVYGMLFGLPLVYLLNQARILGLFFSLRGDPRWFDALHGLVAPVVMIVLIMAYFHTWLSRARLEATAGDP
jgi:exosortase/archaeosortase family protein